MASKFEETLEKAQPRTRKDEHRRWIYVPYDQLTDQLGPLKREDPKSLGIVLAESRLWARRRPYHKQKLALVFANQRHFAVEQARRGVLVDYRITRRAISSELAEAAREHGPLRMMEAAERELRCELESLTSGGKIEVLPHEGWLTTREQFVHGAGEKPPWRMDAFYRHVRQESGLLMEEGSPLGGRYSLDGENRERWKGEPEAPEPPEFPLDDLKKEVCGLIEEEYGDHPGTLDPRHLPASKEDAESLWHWAKRNCMVHFGPFEDAMSAQSRGLFHTRLSGLLNLHRLLPAQVVRDVVKMKIPLNSKEGFLRQVIGWREFVRHVHVATDGFRDLPGQRVRVAEKPGDGGWGIWTGKSWPIGNQPKAIDGGADASFLGHGEAVPPAFWGVRSGLNCLDTVVKDVWDEGWSHHITRLMILSNIAGLLGIGARELTDWFWVAYIDAFDWVVEPNVLGMGTYAAGDVMTTKPYVSGSGYISRMSDYCGGCRFDPRRNCPLTPLYWSFMARHRNALQENQRLRMPMNSLRKRSSEQQRNDREILDKTVACLSKGKGLTPALYQDGDS